jgi:hypothetical protein
VKQNTKKGSYTLEAAIFLPIVIVGIMTLGFTIKMIATAENITFSATDEARLIAGNAYNIPIAPLFANGLKKRIQDENIKITDVEIYNFRYLYQSQDTDGLISFRLNYWIETGLPLGFMDGMDVSQQYLCRGFIGRTAQGFPIPFDEMEKNTSATMVWLFPEGGTRYHTQSCSFVASYPIQTVLNEEIRKRYKPCSKCGSAAAEDGTQVCCYQAYGEAYHLLSCPTVDKYIISMEKNQAESRGYTPCLKCGGVE